MPYERFTDRLPYCEGVTVGKVDMQFDLILEAGYWYVTWGNHYIYIFFDETGNRFSWRTRKEADFTKGEKYRVKGKIKSHLIGGMYRGNTTHIFYCKISKVEQ